MQGQLKEKFLLFRIRAKKDSGAFGELYDMYVRRIYRFIYFKVPSAEVAEDLTSEAFLKAWQYLMKKRDVPHLQALLYSVARSVVVDWYRSTAHERGDVSLDEAIASEASGAGTERLLKAIETDFDVTRALERLRGLKDEYREVVVMKYLDEMSHREIASALGKSTSNVRVIAHRATKALGDVLREEDESQASRKPVRHNQE
ncbi:MAG: RNA polymerase sigma factor [Patescibacteria group bacterium]|nr:RNA polymerase sigma factor [Patescibacteria group bacterium]